ncbi:MAG: PIN domain-containing protein [Clostridiales bacterium]|nr:PIN domain-containing protein [Clostridiales bacterium]
MRLVIDANVLLDVLCERDPFYYDSAAVWDLCEAKAVEGCISVLTFANMVYVMRSPAREVNKLEKQLSLCFSFANLTSQIISEAASLGWIDFEDAVQSVTAKKVRADYIITRNTRDFKKSTVPAVTPKEFLGILRNLET